MGLDAKTWVIILIVLGGALPALGLGLGGWLTRRSYTKLRGDLSKIQTIADAPDTQYPQGKQAAMHAIIKPDNSWLKVEYSLEWMRFKILEKAIEDLRFAAVITVVGLAAGTTGGVWALFLPTS